MCDTEVLENEEPPTWQFQGYFVPAHVLELLNDGVITGTDLILIAMIASLVQHQSKSEAGRGCFATNKYFAERMHCHQMDISRRIQKLKNPKLMILVEVMWKNKRHLELEWSRPTKELNAMSDEYGRLLKIALEELRKEPKEGENEDRASSDEVNISVTGGSTEMFRGGQQKCLGGVNRNVDQYNTNFIEENPIQTPLPPKGGSENEPTNEPPFVGLPQPCSPSEFLASRLIAILERYNLVKMDANKKKTWRKNIYREANKALQLWTFERLEEGLIWFDKNIREPYTPQLYSSKFFSDFRRIDTRLQKLEQKLQQKENIPSFCFELSDALYKYLNAVQELEPEEEQDRAEQIYSIYQKWGANEQAQKHLEEVVYFYKHYHDEYYERSINIPRKIRSIAHLCKLIDWIDNAYQKKKREDDIAW